MQLLRNDELSIPGEKPDARFVKSLKLNRRSQELVTSLLSRGFLEAHIRAIVDSHRSGQAMQSYFAVLELHWKKPQSSKKRSAK